MKPIFVRLVQILRYLFFPQEIGKLYFMYIWFIPTQPKFREDKDRFSVMKAELQICSLKLSGNMRNGEKKDKILPLLYNSAFTEMLAIQFSLAADDWCSKFTLVFLLYAVDIVNMYHTGRHDFQSRHFFFFLQNVDLPPKRVYPHFTSL